MTDAEKAYQYFVIAVPENEEQAKAYFWARKALQSTLTPPNEPLTLADLWDMDGDPVWDKDGKCYIVDTKYRFCSCSDKETVIVDNRGMTHYPCFYILYRRPPEGETDA